MAKEGCVVPVGWPPPPSTHARIFHNGEATKRYSDFSAALLRPTFARGHPSGIWCWCIPQVPYHSNVFPAQMQALPGDESKI